MGKSGSLIFLYPDGDPDNSQYLIGSKVGLRHIFYFFHENPISSNCVLLLTNKQTHGYEFNTSLAEVITFIVSLELK